MSESGNPKALNVALCICTCGRPEGLRKTLKSLEAIRFDGALRVVVVDNHPMMEGLDVCAGLASGLSFRLSWLAEPQPGISQARNAAVKEALCEPVDFVAMIDDDEWPDADWLLQLIACQRARNVPIVYGMVKAHFSETPPGWLMKGGFFRDRLEPHTSNVLYSAEMLRARAINWFEEALGLSGGEDRLFHLSLAANGHAFAFCDKAIVNETIPVDRMGAGYVMRRAFRFGNTDVLIDALQSGRLRPLRWLGHAAGEFAHGLNHLFWSVFNRPRFFRALSDFSEAGGNILGACGIVYRIYASARGLPRYARMGDLRAGDGVDKKPAAPAIRTTPAKLTVRCYHNWAEGLDESFQFLTPGGHGAWGDVQFTTDEKAEADWIGIFNIPRPSPLRVNHSPNRVFFAIGEPPTEQRRLLHVGQGRGTTVLTPDDYFGKTRLVQPRRHLLEPCMTRTWWVRRTIDELRANHVTDKPRRLSWITSNLTEMPGHFYRLAFLEKMRGKVDFDLFGRGFAPLEDKWEGLAPYRYSIAFENHSAPYYFTEKLMDCFLAEAMPIYYGSKAITHFFPEEALVILDPEDPDAVEKIRETIQSDLWLKRRDAIREAKRLVLEKYNMFARLADFVQAASDAPLPKRPLRFTSVKH